MNILLPKNIDYVALPDGDPNWCGLKDDPHFVQCCCNCEFHLAVHYNCCTEPKPPKEKYPDSRCCCPVPKGWACVVNLGDLKPHEIRVYDNWPEHSCGCEMYKAVDEEKDKEARRLANLRKTFRENTEKYAKESA